MEVFHALKQRLYSDLYGVSVRVEVVYVLLGGQVVAPEDELGGVEAAGGCGRLEPGLGLVLEPAPHPHEVCLTPTSALSIGWETQF